MPKKITVAFFDAKEYDSERFALHGDDRIDFRFYDTRLGCDTVALADGADAVCIFVNDDVDGYVIEKLCDMGVGHIALRCAGYNNVDLRAADGKIKVTRVPAYSPHSIAEHAMALLLTSVRRTHKAFIRTRDYNFSLNGLVGFDLYGKTVGVIGTGRIGRAFIDICLGFGMKVLAYDKFPGDVNGVTYTSLESLCENSDIISLHCPLSDETHHMINKPLISKMKRDVIIINTSRGALIDSEELLDAIKERRVGAACLDVYEEESEIFYEDRSGHIMNDDTLARLISMPNVIVTSHQAFLTEEALTAIAETAIADIIRIADGKESENEVSMRTLSYSS